MVYIGPLVAVLHRQPLRLAKDLADLNGITIKMGSGLAVANSQDIRVLL